MLVLNVLFSFGDLVRRGILGKSMSINLKKDLASGYVKL
jgi:hypothetical protein